MGRDAQPPARSGFGTVSAGIGGLGAGGGLAALLVHYLEMPVEIAAIWGALALGAYAYLAGTAATWARDQRANGQNGLLLRLLSGLGVLVLAVGLSGCTLAVGPDSWGLKAEFWQGFNVEASSSPPSLCLGCLETGELEEMAPDPLAESVPEPCGEGEGR